MRKMINGLAFITQTDGKEFYKLVTEKVREMQNLEYEVEIQYRTTETEYSALIIGKVDIK